MGIKWTPCLSTGIYEEWTNRVGEGGQVRVCWGSSGGKEWPGGAANQRGIGLS